MKKLTYLIYIAIITIGFHSCSESTTCQISAKLEGLTTNKLLLVFDDPRSRTDSITINEQSFFYTFSPDTITLIRLVNNKGEYIPIFADRGWEVKIEGSFEHPKISGNGPNQEYQEFLNSIGNANEKDCQTAAIEFVKKHPQSYASAYIINKYLIDVSHPDLNLIRETIQPLHGAIKDCRILSMHRGEIKENNETKRVSYYTFKDRNNKSISLYSNDSKYTLINFWASWKQESCDIHDSLYSRYKNINAKDLRIINYSLDINKEEWIKKCKKDSKNWIEVCDFKVWNHSLIEKHDVRTLPANILINKNREIIEQNIFGKELTDKIKELTDTEKKK